MNTKKKRNKIGIIILAIILTALAAVAAVAVYTISFHKPDNDYDEVVFSTNGLDETENPDETNAQNSSDETNSDETQPPEDEKDEMFNFLILGRDRVALNTDVIMLMNYNVTTKKISIMQIPRDTYILIDKMGYKLNGVYGRYYNEGISNKEKDPEDYGINKLKSLLEQNLCVKIHYYAMVNLNGFRNIVDILDGVEVDIPADMYYVDKDQGLTISLKKGKQTLNGEKAEMFVRYRSGWVQADIGRMDAQKIFMSALLKKVKNSINATNVVKLTNEVFKNVKTDVDLSDMAYFGKNLLDVDMEKMTFMSAPGAAPTPPANCGWYFVINRKGTLNLINEHFNIYNFEITDSIFDANKIFSGNKYATYLTPYYNAEPENVTGGNQQSAEDINQGGITIPKV